MHVWIWFYYDWQRIDCYAGCSAYTTSQQWKRWVFPEGTQLCLVIAGSLQVWLGSKNQTRTQTPHFDGSHGHTLHNALQYPRISAFLTRSPSLYKSNEARPNTTIFLSSEDLCAQNQLLTFLARKPGDTFCSYFRRYSFTKNQLVQWKIWVSKMRTFEPWVQECQPNPCPKQSMPGSQSVLEMSDHVIGISAPGRISDHLWRLHGLFNSTSHLFPIPSFPSTNGNKSPRCTFLAPEPSTSWNPFFKSKAVSIFFLGGCLFQESWNCKQKSQEENLVVLCRPWDCEGFPSPHHWSDHPTLAGLAECPPVLLVLVTSNRVSETNLKSTYPPRPEPSFVK